MSSDNCQKQEETLSSTEIADGIGENISEDEEDEETEEGESGDEEAEEDSYTVQAVKAIRFHKKLKRVEYLVLWQSDLSTSWEPINSFPNGENHLEIKKYRKRNPERVKSVEKEKERAFVRNSNKKKGNKKWVIETVDEDRFEKPDELASGEARRLADPNRLEDPDEKFLKTYGVGIEGRISRSKTRDIRRSIAMNGADSSLSSRQPPKEPITQKRETRGRKKRNTELSALKTKDSPTEMHTSKSKAIENSADVEKKEKKTETVSKLAAGIETWRKKKREHKQNSSDSSDDEMKTGVRPSGKRHEINQKLLSESSISSERIEAGGNSGSMPRARTAETNSATTSSEMDPEHVRRMNDSLALINTQKQTMRRKRMMQKRDSSPEKSSSSESSTDSDVRDPNKDSDSEIERELATFGIVYRRERPIKRLEDELMERRSKVAPEHLASLKNAFLFLDEEAIEILFLESDHIKVMEAMSNPPYYLHDMLATTYELRRRQQSNHQIIEERLLKTERIFRVVLPYVPFEILRVQDESLNTLLHWAINSQDVRLVKHFINLNTPLHIRNQFEISAVESCLIMNNATILEMIIKHGGTFHYMLDERIIKGEDYEKIKNHLKKVDDVVIEVAEKMKRMISKACQRIRDQVNQSRFQEIDFGPIVCFPCSDIRYQENRMTVQFHIPKTWKELRNEYKFMLVVIPMAYHYEKEDFYGSPNLPSQISVFLGDQQCMPATTERSIYYEATQALRRHFDIFEKKETPAVLGFPEIISLKTLSQREKMVRDRISFPFHPDVCTIELDVDRTAILIFLTCQLMVYKPNPNSNPPTGWIPSSSSNQYSAPPQVPDQGISAGISPDGDTPPTR